MTRASMLDALEWVCKLKKKGIMQFEYKNLPAEFKDLALLHRAKGEKFITSLRKNDGRHLWRLSDVKCKDGNNDNMMNIENKDLNVVENSGN